MNNKVSWDEIKNKLNISPEQEAEIRFEEEIIEATIRVRKQKKLSQRELSKISGVKQSAIARIEKSVNSPQTNTLIKLLYPMGYTIAVFPIEEIKKE